jgi:hypothetical protein
MVWSFGVAQTPQAPYFQQVEGGRAEEEEGERAYQPHHGLNTRQALQLPELCAIVPGIGW